MTVGPSESSGAGRAEGRLAGAGPVSRERAWLAAVLSLASILLLPGLGAPRLWQDEAETALLARNVLKFGVPRVWDGENLAAQYYDLDYNAHLVSQRPWLPIYLTAGSLFAFGATTVAARLPSVLCGLAAVFLTWRLGRRLSGDGRVGLLAALFLSVCLPFLSYSRQCRWYALAMVGTLLVLEAEDRLGERQGRLSLALALALLFHTNYLVLLALMGGLVPARLLTRGTDAAWKSLGAALLGAAALTMPFWFFFPPFGFAGVTTDLADYPYRVLWIMSDFNRSLLPVPGLVVLLAFTSRRPLREGWFRRILITLLVGATLAAVPMWPGLVEIIGFRYAVNLLPAAAILLAAAMCAAARRRAPVLAGLAAAQIGLHLGYPLSLWPPSGKTGPVRADLVDYARALAHPVRGPIDAAVEYLEEHARPGDLLYTPYEQLPLQYYTKVRTVSLPGTEEKSASLGITLPAYVSRLDLRTIRWYLPRQGWAGFLGAPSPEQLLRLMGPRAEGAERVELDAPDLLWQTREYPPLYYSRTPRDEPPVVLYRFPAEGREGDPGSPGPAPAARP